MRQVLLKNKIKWVIIYKEKGYGKRHGLIGKLNEPYPKPIRKKQERGIISQWIVPLSHIGVTQLINS
jgi:hypothetical protein